MKLAWRARAIAATLALGIAFGFVRAAQAAGGPLGIDHEWTLDQHGIWSRGSQLALEYGVIAVDLGAALTLGNDDRVGHDFWQSLDAMAVSGAGAEALKLAFSRARPNQGNDPALWFQGRGHESFPSGEVTLQAAFVTPLIVDLAGEHPAIWSLELLPLYDSMARLKSQAHWQTDVIAGWALGTGVGLWTTRWKTPLSVRILPKGLSVGLYHRY